MNKINLKQPIKRLFFLVLPIIFAFLVGAILIAISGHNPLEAYGSMFQGALVGKSALYNTLFSATPIIVTGLAIAVAFKANLFNMGVEGQMYLGAFAAAYVGFSVKGLPTLLHISLCILAAIIAGGLFALIPGFLKGILNVNEMVVTIMLNYVAILFTNYLTNFVFYSGEGYAATYPIAKTAYLPRFMKTSQLNAAFIIALATVGIIYYLFKYTKLGFEIKAIGQNISFAEATGMNTQKKAIIIMVISGMLAGVAGAGEILGVHHRFIAGFSPGYGWDGMTIALLGKNNPIGILIAALFFGILKNGGSTMELMVGVPRSLISIIQGLIIFFLAVDYLNTEFQFMSRFKFRFQKKVRG